MKKSTVVEQIKNFDKIYVINLKNRADRRKEVIAELEDIGLSKKDVTFFSAIAPKETAGFESVGAHGCFMSHLNVLRDAKTNGYQKIAILEDDVDFTDYMTEKTEIDLEAKSWDIFYGDYQLFEESPIKKPLDYAKPELAIGTTPFMAFNGESKIDRVVDYLEKILTREPGHVDGGPMHVDGAYSWFRKDNPDILTLLPRRKLCFQRPSSSNVSLSRFDKIPYLAFPLKIYRFGKRLVKRLIMKPITLTKSIIRRHSGKH